MGKIEEKIKQDLLQEIFSDTFKVYDFIDSRFKLDEQTRSEVITKINTLNDELTKLLKETKLS
jgi:ubiquinone/menaquinone biosynthesis C-methylase UbiE